MTLSRIQTMEKLGFEWDNRGAAWEDRLSELADYRKIHGHSNVPKRYSKSNNLGRWVISYKAKGPLQVAPTRKDIAYDHLPNPGIEKPWF